PIATRLLGLIGAPNIPGATLGAPGYVYGSPNYVFNEVREKITNAFDVKLNYHINDKNDLSYRFSFQRPEISDPGAFGVYGGPNSGGGFDGNGSQKTISTAANYTRTFSPTLILEARLGVSWYHNVATTVADGMNTSNDLGIPGVNIDEFSSGLTHINIAGFSDPLLGFNASLPWDRGETTYIGSGIVTKIWGNHTLKFGEEIQKNRDYLLQIQDAGGPRGEFQFSGGQTATKGDNMAIGGIANSFASFLLDMPSLVRRDIKVLDQPGTKHWSFFEFIQDKWQVNQKLTLDIGLRHEYYTPLVGLVDKGGLSNYNPSDNTERVAGYGDIPQNVGVKETWKNFAPRFGVAYRITDKTVVRAGYGVSIIPFPDNRYAFNFPVKQTNVFNAPNSFQPAGSLAAGFAAPVLFDIPANGIIDASLPILKASALQSVPADLREARLHSWNVAFQRELWWGLTAEAAYVGNTGRGVLADFNLNAATELGTAVVGNDNAARQLFATTGRTVDVIQRVRTNTHYNALQTKLDRRFKNGFLLSTSYTYGRAITGMGTDNGSIDTPADPKIDVGRAGFDITHSFVQSFVWAIPFAEKTHGWLKWALDGWQVTGILVAQTGTPLDFTLSGANLHAPGNTQRPNISGDPKVLGGFGPGQLYFDTSVFSVPAETLTGLVDPNLHYAPFGNMTRNSSINGPGYWNLDASVFKRFRFTERLGGELRVDSFNILNHPNPGNPQTSVTSTTFGQINSTASTPRVLRFGAKVTF
ncbi:MAG: TonB-dependent receptor, partial [Blastocatellia bacterium]|nr:TonB-dependent receptor [Blastocatellia bacterium]